MRDSSSCLLHHFRGSHEEISSFNADNFWAGRRALMKQIRDLIGVHKDPLHQIGDRIEDKGS